MRSGIRVVNLALLVSTGLLAVRALPAQSLSPCVRQVRLSVERDIFMPTTRNNVRPAYTATVKQTFEQPLSDGNTIRWTVGPGTMALANISHMQEPTAQPDLKDIPRTPATPYKPQITREDLGTRTIAGMEATGNRMTEIIPAGQEGNDAPLKVVHETWFSRDNHTPLLAIDDDPRTGHRTWEVESLTVGPPDPALFTPPANYKVWEQNPRPQATADAKP